MICMELKSNAKRKPIFTSIAIVLTLCALLSVCLSACNKNPYASDNSFAVDVVDTDEALTFAPKGFKCSYGVILYVGALVSPSYYSYLGTALAKQGYLAVIPKFNLNMSAQDYKEKEAAFENYKDVKFFIAGHDQGGGAAIRRAQENPGKIAGVLLYSPLVVPRIILDEDGRPSKDDDGNWLYANDSIANLNLPTLWIESDDATRTDDVKSGISERLNQSTVTEYAIKNSTALGFTSTLLDSYKNDENGNLTGDNALTDEEKSALENAQNQLDLTVKYTLKFLKNCVC